MSAYKSRKGRRSWTYARIRQDSHHDRYPGAWLRVRVPVQLRDELRREESRTDERDREA